LNASFAIADFPFGRKLKSKSVNITILPLNKIGDCFADDLGL
jgi:hypothetical protein